MNVRVSELLVRFMERLGVEVIFGMPGAHILPVYDGLYDSPIRSVLVKHEQGAAFMAGGYARASGKIGACITTAGPGATNLVTGIASAYADKLPILIVTGEAPTYLFGKGGLQESSGEGGSIDQSALFAGITRYHRIVERTDYLANVLNRAAQILRSPSPGPVLLSFPFNVQKELVDDAILDRIRVDAPPVRPRDTAPIERLTELLLAAESPVIVAGYGCIKAGGQELVTELSESLNVPVVTSLKGKGAISERSALWPRALGWRRYVSSKRRMTRPAVFRVPCSTRRVSSGKLPCRVLNAKNPCRVLSVPAYRLRQAGSLEGLATANELQIPQELAVHTGAKIYAALLAREIDNDQPRLALHVIDRDVIAVALLQLLQQRQRVVIVGEAHGLARVQGVERAEDRRVPEPLGDAAGVERIELVGAKMQMRMRLGHGASMGTLRGSDVAARTGIPERAANT